MSENNGGRPYGNHGNGGRMKEYNIMIDFNNLVI